MPLGHLIGVVVKIGGVPAGDDIATVIVQLASLVCQAVEISLRGQGVIAAAGQTLDTLPMGPPPKRAEQVHRLGESVLVSRWDVSRVYRVRVLHTDLVCARQLATAIIQRLEQFAAEGACVALATMVRALDGAHSADAAAKEVRGLLLARCGIDQVVLFARDEGPKPGWRIIGASDYDTQAGFPPGMLLAISEDPVAARLWNRVEPSIIEDASKTSVVLEERRHRRQGISSLLHIPCIRDGVVVGAVAAVSTGHVRHFLAHDVAFFSVLGVLLGPVIDRVRIQHAPVPNAPVLAARQERAGLGATLESLTYSMAADNASREAARLISVRHGGASIVVHIDGAMPGASERPPPLDAMLSAIAPGPTTVTRADDLPADLKWWMQGSNYRSMVAHRAGSCVVAAFTRKRWSKAQLEDLQVWCQHLETGRRRAAQHRVAGRRDAVLRAMIEQSQEGFNLVDESGHLIEANRSMGEMTGYSVAELLTMSVHQLVPNDRPLRMLPKLLEATDLVVMRETLLRRKDGSTFTAELRGFPVDVLGERLMVTFARDLTQELAERESREALQVELRQARRMESVGRLAGSIAHDFNNLLMVIVGHCEMALDTVGAQHPVNEDIAGIHRAADRATELVRRLLAFSRQEAPSTSLLELQCIIEELGLMLERLMPANIAIDLRFAPGLHVQGNQTDLEQALVNLCVNARDAIGPDTPGRVTIGCRIAELSATDSSLKAGRWAVVSVEDTGPGMAPEVVERAFEPFFTTKSRDQGTGLGLATVYGIARQHGGVARLHSTLGVGTRAEVWLPIATGTPVPRAPTPPTTTRRPQGTETVLIAEDQEDLRRLYVRVLEGAGYVAIPACDGAEATQLYAAQADRIELVLLDVIMPTMGGREACERIRETNPSARVLFMSGYTGAQLPFEYLQAHGLQLLRKPCTPIDFLRAVRAALDDLPIPAVS